MVKEGLTPKEAVEAAEKYKKEREEEGLSDKGQEAIQGEIAGAVEPKLDPEKDLESLQEPTSDEKPSEDPPQKQGNSWMSRGMRSMRGEPETEE